MEIFKVSMTLDFLRKLIKRCNLQAINVIFFLKFLCTVFTRTITPNVSKPTVELIF